MNFQIVETEIDILYEPSFYMTCKRPLLLGRLLHDNKEFMLLADAEATQSQI